MIGKKRKASFQAEQPNLKRLRKVVESLAGESSSKTETFIVRESLRKKRRKEDRNLKKMRKNAHRRGDRLPTKKGLEIKREKEVRKKLRQKKKKLERKIEREKKAEEKRLAQEEKEQEEHEEMLREREIQMANKADDKIIRELEKKLHMTKKKGKKKIPQSFAAEGLDYLLDVLEGSGKDGDDAFTNEDSNSKNLDNSDQEELDESDEIMEEEFEGDSEDGGDEEGEEFEESDQESESEDILDEEEEKQEDEDDVDNVNDFQKKKKNINLSSKEKEIKDDSKNLMKEDIYGRTFDSSGQEVSKAYVPPALRTSSSEDMKVKRKIQGLVNRLGETNKLKISVEIEQVYRENSRAIVTEALTSSIISSCLQKSQVAQKSISDYIELLAIISSSIGFEISAMFLQTVAEKWIELCKDSDEEDKKLLNCTQIICALYNLKLLKSPLVLDLLGHICSSNQLFHVEVILIIVTQCGFILRKDDPIGLKNVINLVKEKSVQLIDENKGGYSRTEFMMDCLLAVRNNDVRKLPNYDEELIPNVLKAYKNILKQRNLLQANPLNVRLEDITEADKRGKWWLVGAAWTGDKSTKDVEKEKITKSKFSNKVMKLAVKLRMNTDIRKQIFCSMFSASDAEDAVRQMLSLANTAAHKRELINVPLDVLLRSKKNDWFVLSVLKSLSNFDRKYNIILSAAVREKICQEHDKDDTYKRLAFLLNELLLNDVLRLNILKELNFTQLNPRLEKILIDLLKKICSLEHRKILNIFSRATDKIVNYGLQYFTRAKLADSIDEEIILLIENGLKMGLKKKKL